MGIVGLRNLDKLPIYRNHIGFWIDARSQLAHHPSIHRHAASHDHIFGGPQRSHSCTCQYFV